MCVNLSMQGNYLRTLEPLAALSGLEVILAARNCLVNVRGLEGLAGLRRLDVAGNAIASLDGISYVRGAAVLSELYTAGNPMDKVRLDIGFIVLNRYENIMARADIHIISHIFAVYECPSACG